MTRVKTNKLFLFTVSYYILLQSSYPLPFCRKKKTSINNCIGSKKVEERKSCTFLCVSQGPPTFFHMYLLLVFLMWKEDHILSHTNNTLIDKRLESPGISVKILLLIVVISNPPKKLVNQSVHFPHCYWSQAGALSTNILPRGKAC